MKIQDHSKPKCNLNPKALEIIFPSRKTSEIISAAPYKACLKEFETMAASDGARFKSALGSCEVAFSLHHESANIILLRNGREDLGKGRLVWSPTHLNGIRVTSLIKGLPLTSRNIPCLIVDLADSFESKATPEVVNLAVHSLAASAFGLLNYLAKAPAVNSYESALEIPTSPLFPVPNEKATNEIDL